MKNLFKSVSTALCGIILAGALGGCAKYGLVTPTRPMGEVNYAWSNTAYTITSNKQMIQSGHPEHVLPTGTPELMACERAQHWRQSLQDPQYGADYNQARQDLNAYVASHKCPSLPELNAYLERIRNAQYSHFNK